MNGELVISTLPLPKDTNGNGDIFGGWIVSQMDLGGAILARKISKSKCVTVAMDKIVFLKPVPLTCMFCCYADVVKVGNTSITIKIECWTTEVITEVQHLVAEGILTYVAVDDNMKPKPIFTLLSQEVS